MVTEWIILADAAQVIGGKLYLLGGGWNRVLHPTHVYPLQRVVTVAVAFRIAWEETNVPHPFEVELLDGDGTGLGVKLEGNAECGREIGVPPGSDQRLLFAIEAAVSIPQAGAYVVVTRVNGEESGRVAFAVGVR